jgi:hypothetical protein
MRYRLRTLLIVLAILPPLLAWGWRRVDDHRRYEEIKRLVMAMESYSGVRLQRDPPPADYLRIKWEPAGVGAHQVDFRP